MNTNISEEILNEMAVAKINLYFDNSGSMKPHGKKIKDAAIATLNSLAELNKKNIDIAYIVRLATFNDKVMLVNSSYMMPEDVLLLIKENTFECKSTTVISNVFIDLDNIFSRNSETINTLKKSDSEIINIIVTDYNGTDTVQERAASVSTLKGNNYYKKYGHTLVIYLGNETNKKEAIAFTGDEKDVIAFDEDFAHLIAPVIINTSVVMSFGTHTGSVNLMNQSPSEIAEEAKARAVDGLNSAEELSDEDLRNQLYKLLDI